jgi:hypothetical protein
LESWADEDLYTDGWEPSGEPFGTGKAAERRGRRNNCCFGLECTLFTSGIGVVLASWFVNFEYSFSSYEMILSFHESFASCFIKIL